ncbi:hypothetical protein SPRG_13072 [Saprolegnia parasitica CBS 223.65]|uniref:Elicitin n=1 Tax=Saprolegnia parasitica (strain CBS 223.65) TaxID=695850 RepID=A0A067BZF3_SAPPC|nr:hypothetical protein SPRG_13072 [Saprolegnia parasitica CBS 223.65]KDO19967.1 hypothetical protein SPRG_13072 [Saprolegnia parasitica CBS 223.65]|eukprot:XP_012209337.1 hypothetical protein SPRG_13072 [Saprolegnia parasitica CBS 223.65]
MKTSTLLLAIAASTVTASDPCSIPSLLNTLTPLQAQIPACTDASGYNLMLIATGSAPTADQAKKLASTQACKDLYATMQEKVSKIAPPCSIGGVETSTFTSVEVSSGIAAMLKALGGSPSAPGASTAAPANNSTKSANSTITAAPGNGTSKSNSSNTVTTPAPTKPSSAAATGVALTAAAVTMLAAMA